MKRIDISESVCTSSEMQTKTNSGVYPAGTVLVCINNPVLHDSALLIVSIELFTHFHQVRRNVEGVMLECWGKGWRDILGDVCVFRGGGALLVNTNAERAGSRRRCAGKCSNGSKTKRFRTHYFIRGRETFTR